VIFRLTLLFTSLTCACCYVQPADGAESVTVRSPNGGLKITFSLSDLEAEEQIPTYHVTYQGKSVICRSRMGWLLDGDPSAAKLLRHRLTILSIDKTHQHNTWEPVYGERSEIRDHYNGAIVTLQCAGKNPPIWKVELRAYDEGVAFCYHVPSQEALNAFRVEKEITEFRFAEDLEAWAVYSAQGVYEKTRVSQLKRGCERPLVLRDSAGLYLAVGEARLVDFARMKLSPLPEHPHALVSDLSGSVECTTPVRSPWRVIMVAERPGQLLENNDIFLNLNDPCAIQDPSWIRPGKVIREVTLSTTGGKACVDFAARNGLQFVEFDAGWYGHEYDDVSDATTITVDPKRSPGPLDLHEVIRYAKSKGIGIIVYVNRRALEKQLDEILPLYREWGIAGVKYGFVNVGSQHWTTWLHAAVRKAARHQLMVDVHDEYRPTGYSRTYPNLMTQEGIGGDETSPSNEQTLTILFTRMVAGAGDNTICYFNKRVEQNASYAYQLAKAVCIYSPWQFVYWYDRPIGSPGTKGGAGGGHGIIGDEPELDFFAHVPTVWDETRVIHGQIGHYAVIARRAGRSWFVGAMNDGTARSLKLPLDFLDPDCDYVATIYRDDPSVTTRTQVGIEQRGVTAEQTLELNLPARGGQALEIKPR